MYVCVYVCMHVYVCVCMYVCMYVCIVGRRIKIFLRLKADGKIVLLVTSVASFAKVLHVNKS